MRKQRERRRRKTGAKSAPVSDAENGWNILPLSRPQPKPLGWKGVAVVLAISAPFWLLWPVPTMLVVLFGPMAWSIIKREYRRHQDAGSEEI